MDKDYTFCNEINCLRKIFKPHLYCDKHRDESSSIRNEMEQIDMNINIKDESSDFDIIGRASAEEFVTVFVSAIKNDRDPAWIGRKLNMSAANVNSRAARYRKLGIQLPYFNNSRDSHKIDVSKINKEILGI